jgi:hypothetical protein
MSETTVKFPVTCPKCGRKRPAELPVDMLAFSLQRGSHIYFVATCHHVIWAATEVELEQIREYLGATSADERHRS